MHRSIVSHQGGSVIPRLHTRENSTSRYELLHHRWGKCSQLDFRDSLRGKRSGHCQRGRGEDANCACKKEHDFEHSPRLVAGHMRPRLLHESSMPQR
jgi:hypothetical protein